MESNKTYVTIRKVYMPDGTYYYNICDENLECIDGFRKKWQAIDAIKKYGFIRKDTTVKVNY